MKRISSLLALLEFDSLRSLFDILPGCGFRPRDDELISFLKHKMDGNESKVELIPVVYICEYEPWDLPTLQEFYQINPKDPDWFFFSPIVQKYRDSQRVNRSTKTGYWKPTGQDRVIKDEHQDIIGRKKSLIFYEGRTSHDSKTNWTYHEYQLVSPLSDKSTYVLCHLMNKVQKVTQETTHPNSERDEPSDSMSCVLNNDGDQNSNRSPDFANPPTDNSLSEINDIPQENSSPNLQASDDDYMESMKYLTLPNDSNIIPMLSETYDMGEFVPNYSNQTSTYEKEPLSPYNHSLMQQYFGGESSSSYGGNQIAFVQPNSYSSIGGYEFLDF